MRVAKSRVAIWLVLAAGFAAFLAITITHLRKTYRITLQGAVIRQDKDPDKQFPITNVQITAISGSSVIKTTSDPSGFFTITLPRGLRRKEPLELDFRHPEYRPLNVKEFVADKLYVVYMQPLPIEQPVTSDRPDIDVSNVRVRYSVKSTSTVDVGSAVKTFQVVNTGNIPCHGRNPCSPDGKWKAAIASTSLDAGEGDEFRNARATCLAGPCSFAKVEYDNLSRDGRMLSVAARNWSDTVTFVVEAEVVHPMVSDLVRDSYPVIFGRSLTFSLPASAEGPSIDAEVDGQAIVFPLGPDLLLGWAQCTLEMSKEENRVYRCELKPGYRFK
jgi:hypothetical protein